MVLKGSQGTMQSRKILISMRVMTMTDKRVKTKMNVTAPIRVARAGDIRLEDCNIKQQAMTPFNPHDILKDYGLHAFQDGKMYFRMEDVKDAMRRLNELKVPTITATERERDELRERIEARILEVEQIISRLRIKDSIETDIENFYMDIRTELTQLLKQ
jgi:hypothetical protein